MQPEFTSKQQLTDYLISLTKDMNLFAQTYFSLIKAYPHLYECPSTDSLEISVVHRIQPGYEDLATFAEALFGLYSRIS